MCGECCYLSWKYINDLWILVCFYKYCVGFVIFNFWDCFVLIRNFVFYISWSWGFNFFCRWCSRVRLIVLCSWIRGEIYWEFKWWSYFIVSIDKIWGRGIGNFIGGYIMCILVVFKVLFRRMVVGGDMRIVMLVYFIWFFVYFGLWMCWLWLNSFFI